MHDCLGGALLEASGKVCVLSEAFLLLLSYKRVADDTSSLLLEEEKLLVIQNGTNHMDSLQVGFLCSPITVTYNYSKCKA